MPQEQHIGIDLVDGIGKRTCLRRQGEQADDAEKSGKPAGQGMRSHPFYPLIRSI